MPPRPTAAASTASSATNCWPARRAASSSRTICATRWSAGPVPRRLSAGRHRPRATRIVGYEALIRWDHPTRGAIIARRIHPDRRGMRADRGDRRMGAAHRLHARRRAGRDDVRVAVNVSPIQFANPALPAIVTSRAGAIRASPPQRLELEITEGVFLDETASSEQMFEALKGIGVRLALDDFGTGYSSLGYLRKAPFDKIKIDQSFVRGAAVAGQPQRRDHQGDRHARRHARHGDHRRGRRGSGRDRPDPRARLQPHPGLSSMASRRAAEE